MDDLIRQWHGFAAALGAPAPPAGAAFGHSAGFAPFIEAAERFAAATRSFRDASHGASAPAVQAAAETFGNFLRDQFAASFKMPWTAAPPAGSEAAASPEFPALGLTREHQQRAQRAALALRDMDEAQRRLQRLWSDTLREAAAAYVARLGAPSAAALTPDAVNKLYDTWIDCAEEAYARTAHSEAFCDALADYVNAGSRWRRESNAGAELWAKLLDLPTRNEVNTLAQRLRVLEEQIGARSESRRDAAAAEPGAPRAPRAPRAARARRPPKGKP